MSIHIRPSWFVRQARVYRSWCKITKCANCGVVGKYEDFHPVNPCVYCGSLRDKTKYDYIKKELVGRWIDTTKWYEFWKVKGYWEIKE